MRKLSNVRVAVVIVAVLAVASAAYWQYARPGSERTVEHVEVYAPPVDLSLWTAKDVRYDLEAKGIVIPDHLDGVWVEDRFFSREEIYGGPVFNDLGVDRIVSQGDSSPKE